MLENQGNDLGKVGLEGGHAERVSPHRELPLDGPGTSIILQATEGANVTVPGGAFLLTADYGRSGADLILTGADYGSVIVVRDFFALDDAPNLRTEGGAQVSAALAARLAGSRSPGQYAAADDAALSAPIGKVTELAGEATATRVDGSKVTLAKDMTVHQGDIIETGGGAALKVVFLDESTFSIGESGRIVLDEFVFDPTSLEGASSVSLVQGVFVFISGEIAANNPDQMVLKTPVATIGIRGTAVAIQATQEGEENKIVLLPEKNEDGEETVGSVKVSNEGGSVVLDEAFEGTLVDSLFSLPSDPSLATPEEIAFLLRRLQKLAPDSIEHLMPTESGDDQATPGEALDQTGTAAPGEALSEIAPAAGEGPAPTIETPDIPDAAPLPEAFQSIFEPSIFQPPEPVAPNAPPPPPDTTAQDAATVDDDDIIAAAPDPVFDPPPPPAPPTLSIGDASVLEGGNLVFGLTLSGPSADVIVLQLVTSSCDFKDVPKLTVSLTDVSHRSRINLTRQANRQSSRRLRGELNHGRALGDVRRQSRHRTERFVAKGAWQEMGCQGAAAGQPAWRRQGQVLLHRL